MGAPRSAAGDRAAHGKGRPGVRLPPGQEGARAARRRPGVREGVEGHHRPAVVHPDRARGRRGVRETLRGARRGMGAPRRLSPRGLGPPLRPPSPPRREVRLRSPRGRLPPAEAPGPIPRPREGRAGGNGLRPSRYVDARGRASGRPPGVLARSLRADEPRVRDLRPRGRVPTTRALEAPVRGRREGDPVRGGYGSLPRPDRATGALDVGAGQLPGGPGGVSRLGRELARGGSLGRVRRQEPPDAAPLVPGRRPRALLRSPAHQQLRRQGPRRGREASQPQRLRYLRHGGQRARVVVERGRRPPLHARRRLERPDLPLHGPGRARPFGAPSTSTGRPRRPSAP